MGWNFYFPSARLCLVAHHLSQSKRENEVGGQGVLTLSGLERALGAAEWNGWGTAGEGVRDDGTPSMARCLIAPGNAPTTPTIEQFACANQRMALHAYLIAIG